MTNNIHIECADNEPGTTWTRRAKERTNYDIILEQDQQMDNCPNRFANVVNL